MSSDGVRLFILFAGVFVLLAAMIAASVRYARKRARELTEIAQQIGFQFIGKNWSGPVLSSQHKTSLLQLHRGQYNNVMTRAFGGVQVSLFDYTYPAGKTSATQILATFSQDLPLPPFAPKTSSTALATPSSTTTSTSIRTRSFPGATSYAAPRRPTREDSSPQACWLTSNKSKPTGTSKPQDRLSSSTVEQCRTTLLICQHFSTRLPESHAHSLLPKD